MNEQSLEVRQTVERALQVAIQCHQAGELTDAESLYRRVLMVHPKHSVALHNLALILLARGDIATALELLGAAVRENPLEPGFQFNRAVALQTAQQFEAAIAAYQKALDLKPDYLEAWENLGVALQEVERFGDALNAYTKALHLNRCSPVAQKNIGNLLRTMGRLDEAENHYLDALDCNPLDGDIALQYATTLLSRGEFSSGWDWYEWRYWSPESLAADPPHRIPLPKWDGTSLDDQQLLLYGEQGIGDEIMFASCIPDVATQTNRTVLLCSPRLEPLFTRSFPQITVLPRDSRTETPLPAIALACGIRLSTASLPRYFRKTNNCFPGTPYLTADNAMVLQWRQRLEQLGSRLTVGLSWRGGTARRANYARSVALEHLAPLFEHQDISFINVQYGDNEKEIGQFNALHSRPLICFDELDPMKDMDGFAAFLEALDLVITVDNSTAHLAGALGVETWLMLPAHADWRWVRESDDTLWYKTIRIFRQSSIKQEAWTAVIGRINTALGNTELARSPSYVRPAIVKPKSHSKPDILPTALLLNDTTFWYHWGCTCTSIGLHEGIRSAGYVVDSVPITEINTLTPLPASIDDLDSDTFFQAFCAQNPKLIDRIKGAATVVVNGEGSIHGLGQTAVGLLYCAYFAKRHLNKHTQIINHSCYPSTGNQPSDHADEFYKKVYQAMDFVAVREEHSAKILEKLGVTTVQAFDCLPLFVNHHPPILHESDTPRVVLAGTVQLTTEFLDMMAGIAERLIGEGYTIDVLVGANAAIAKDDVQFVAALHQRLRGRYRLIAAKSEEEWLTTIGEADLLVSGRFHHSIAAACLGTRFLVSASNTEKIDGMLRQLGLSKEQTWISPDEPHRAIKIVLAKLKKHSPGYPAPTPMATLCKVAQGNFSGLPPKNNHDA